MRTRALIWLLATAAPTPLLAQAATPTVQVGERSSSGTTAPVAGTEFQDGNVGDIVVTATRRAERLSDVPISVNVISGSELQRTGATDIRLLNQVSPSLFVSSASSEGAGTARIRGIGTSGENLGLESAVALFVDGVYRSRTGVGLGELGEIDRVEVLRGPQGTLFGRNASAGLISVVTASPRFTVGGYGAVSVGNYNMRRIEGGLTGPIIGDTVAARLDGVYMKRDGFLTDVTSGRTLYDRDRYLLRGQILIRPTSDISLRLIGDYSKKSEECCQPAYLAPEQDTRRDASGAVVQTPSSLLPLLQSLGANIQLPASNRGYVYRTALSPGRGAFAPTEDWGVSGELDWAFGSTNLTSITAYRDWKSVAAVDADFNALDILYREGQQRRFRTFSQELRLQGKAFGDRVDWLIGGYYANEKLNLTDNLRYGTDFERYANCLALSSALPSAVLPSNPFCVNVPVVRATIAGLSALPATDPRRANIPLLSAVIANPARPGFGSIAAVLGQPNIVIAGTGEQADQFKQRSENFALFTHNIIQIVPDRLSLTLGARYTRDRKTLDADLSADNSICTLIARSPFAALAQLPCVIPTGSNGVYSSSGPGGRRTDSEWTGTAVLSYKPTSETLAYASYSRGFKAGGYNLDRLALDSTAPSLVQLQFEPEKVTAFEIGTKLNIRRFTFSAAAFYQLFSNYQFNSFLGTRFQVTNIQSCTTSLNGADRDGSSLTGACTSDLRPGITSKGIELEASMRPGRYLNVNTGFTLNDARYRNNLVGADGAPLPADQFQLPGRRIATAPLYVVTGSAAWTPPLGNSGINALVYADFRFNSDFANGPDLDIEKNQDAFTVVNVRLGVSGKDQRWGLEFFAQNVFNTRYVQVVTDATLQGSDTYRQVAQGISTSANQLYAAFPAEPRTYGVTLRSRF